VAPNPDRELAEARGCIDRGDEAGAVKRLDRARRGYLKRRDAAGLEHLLVLGDVLEGKDDRARIGRDNLVYAIKQNLRQESRRLAQQQGEPWQDPYPDLQAPSEHTRIAFTRGVKFWIAVGVALGVALTAGIILAVALSSSSEPDVTLRLVNDTGASVTVRGCDDTSCFSFWMHADLDPGLQTEREVPADDLVDVFRVKRPGLAEECLPLLVHDGYVLAGSQTPLTLVAKLSDATPCPGTTVRPRPAPESGL
jgi:hypothetical protein